MQKLQGIHKMVCAGLFSLVGACGTPDETSDSLGTSMTNPTATGTTGAATGMTGAPTTSGMSGTTGGSETMTAGTGPGGPTGGEPTTGALTSGTTSVDPSAGTTTSPGTTTGGIDQCAGSTVEATPIPLDIYVMLDKSGSMLDKTGMKGQGISKWEAVTTALDSFFKDPQSAGIGVGLQYFPLIDEAAPDSCKSQAECGKFGPCFLKVCEKDTGIVCTANADCGNFGPCAALGQCANDPATFCLPIGATCAGNKGKCVQVTSSVCLGVDSCVADDYATPAVPVAELNGAAAALVASMNGTAPEGATPTGPALQGAIDHASQWAVANPTHKVVALLATDGLPTECTPLDGAGLAKIAAAGFAGEPSIPTFVIGVFSGNDANAKALIDQIAKAGGTDSAFYIDAMQAVDQAFLDALNAIRGAKLACEYQIPPPPKDEMLDFNKVNVLNTPEGADQPNVVLYVGSADNCDPATGGWYYDVDPKLGETPTKILMCPQTCDTFGLGGVVDIQLGCETVIPG
ncbi:MAG: hypothetical protein H0T76_19475 [Nannocystis sp.]|nr:hypothetical protein [Nannocystis sp.]MBA3548672.1 hypothetical protein [Nannocystis sp.]